MLFQSMAAKAKYFIEKKIAISPSLMQEGLDSLLPEIKKYLE